MNWNEQYPKEKQPEMIQIGTYISSPLWQDLCSYVETAYQISPHMEHSICGGAPGWNIKYKKSGRALCTLYPAKGFFTCLISIGTKEAQEAELLLSKCTETVQELYWKTKPFNGSRWLMIEVTSPAILENIKALIGTRVKPKIIIKNPLEDLVANLKNQNPQIGCDCFTQLLEESRRCNAVYPYFDEFAELMSSDNSYLRTRGLLLISANARWDKDGKIDQIIDRYLSHVMDPKPTVARQFIAALPELAQYKPELAAKIYRALQNADPHRYRSSMSPLIEKDIAVALAQINKAI